MPAGGTKLAGGYDMAVLTYPGASAGGPNADPDLLRQLFSSASPPSLTGATGYANPAFDELAARQLVTFDEASRTELISQVQQVLAEVLPMLALYYPERVALFRQDVLDQWYFTPGSFPTSENNKQLFITGRSEASCALSNDGWCERMVGTCRGIDLKVTARRRSSARVRPDD